ncbi:MAG: hypothetical protein JNJ49_12635 [Bdellovibrionaceae bacterium]|nr:hypothetical protein [Pseudobdellovibrionaceae bacterium]
MKTFVLVTLLSLAGTVANAETYGPQQCSTSPKTNNSQIFYTASCGTEEGICDISINAKNFDLSLKKAESGSNRAAIEIKPYSGGEITIATREAGDVTVILKRTGTVGYLTLLSDQNLIVDNAAMVCAPYTDL